jgi:hypothetical protein
MPLQEKLSTSRLPPFPARAKGINLHFRKIDD